MKLRTISFVLCVPTRKSVWREILCTWWSQRIPFTREQNIYIQHLPTDLKIYFYVWIRSASCSSRACRVTIRRMLPSVLAAVPCWQRMQQKIPGFAISMINFQGLNHNLSSKRLRNRRILCWDGLVNRLLLIHCFNSLDNVLADTKIYICK